MHFVYEDSGVFNILKEEAFWKSSIWDWEKVPHSYFISKLMLVPTEQVSFYKCMS